MTNWKRYWYPSEQEPIYTDEGYLIKPNEGIWNNNQLIDDPISKETRCIILLGEPGMGKSYEMELYSQKFKEKSTNKCYFINLNIISNGMDFEEKVFQNKEIENWKDSSSENLFLLLDSFDEAYLQDRRIIQKLTYHLENLPLDRLFLRIACRAGYWPPSLGNDLKHLFKKEDYQELHIAPLAKDDVKMAISESVSEEDITPEGFIKKIEEKEIVPFATRPITLDGIIRSYCKNKDLPNTKYEIYENYCRYLAKEVDDGRRDRTGPPDSTPQQRYNITSRYAAICKLSGKESLWTENNEEDMPDNYLSHHFLWNKRQKTEEVEKEITPKITEETLATALFNSYTPNRGWAHSTFMEFLAADWVKQKELDFTQIISLVTNPEDPEKKIYFSLRGVCSWISEYRNDFFEYLLENEPDILLEADLSTFSSQDRVRIIKDLLEYIEQTSNLRFFNYTPFLEKLKHPNSFRS